MVRTSEIGTNCRILDNSRPHNVAYSSTPMRLRGTAVRRLRWDRGWTQQELADKSGLSRHTISRIEDGSSAGGPKSAKKLAIALGVAVSDITSDDDEVTYRDTTLATG